MRGLLRHHGRTGLRLRECRRQLASNCSRLAGSAVGRGANAVMIRVVLPPHLRILAHVTGDVELQVDGPATLRSVLDALEERYPMLRGTIRDHGTLKRRDF